MSVATKHRVRNTFSSGDYLASLMAELDRAQISKRIRAARKQAGLKSQGELGDLLHVHWRTVQDWENPRHANVPWDRMDEIAQVTDTSKFWLLHGREAPDVATVGEILDRLQLLAASVAELPTKEDLQRGLDAMREAIAARASQDIEPGEESL